AGGLYQRDAAAISGDSYRRHAFVQRAVADFNAESTDWLYCGAAAGLNGQDDRRDRRDRSEHPRHERHASLGRCRRGWRGDGRVTRGIVKELLDGDAYVADRLDTPVGVLPQTPLEKRSNGLRRRCRKRGPVRIAVPDRPEDVRN